MRSIIVGARKSPLSQAQVKEVLSELKQHFPDIQFAPLFAETYGDQQQHISLRHLEKTDFFTREIDQLLLSKACRIAIHSAKDLSDPLPEGIELIALTKGVDSSDCLVMRHGEQFHKLPPRAKIGTSSFRREQAIMKMRDDFLFIDIRGNISQRLDKLGTFELDGVVIAEAALIRLGLTHLNRIKIPGETVPHQGQLAVMARVGDKEMQDLFRPLDVRILKCN